MQKSQIMIIVGGIIAVIALIGIVLVLYCTGFFSKEDEKSESSGEKSQPPAADATKTKNPSTDATKSNDPPKGNANPTTPVNKAGSTDEKTNDPPKAEENKAGSTDKKTNDPLKSDENKENSTDENEKKPPTPGN